MYDLLVMAAPAGQGWGIGPLAMGAVAARRGMRVAVIEQTERLYPDPPLLYFGFSPGGPGDSLFREVGLPLSAGWKSEGLLTRPVPICQGLLPEHRISVFSGRQEYHDEIKREFGERAVAILSKIEEDARLLEERPRTLLLRTRRRVHWARVVLSGAHRSLSGAPPDFVSFLQLLSLGISGKPAHRAIDLARLCGGLAAGAVRAPLGAVSIRSALTNIILSSRGERIRGSPKEVSVDRKTVRIWLGSTEVEGRGLAVERDDGRWSEFFEVESRVIPEPMSGDLFYTLDDAPPSRANVIGISRFAAPGGSTGLAVSGFRESEGRRPDLEGRLGTLLPFSTGKIRQIPAAGRQKFPSLPKGRVISVLPADSGLVGTMEGVKIALDNAARAPV